MIRVSDDVKEALDVVKERVGGSYNDAIRYLLSIISDPRMTLYAMLSWILDLRDDVKTIRKSIENFSATAEELKELLLAQR